MFHVIPYNDCKYEQTLIFIGQVPFINSNHTMELFFLRFFIFFIFYFFYEKRKNIRNLVEHKCTQ